MYAWTNYDSPLGTLTLAGSEEALTGLWLPGQKYFAATLAVGCPPAGCPAGIPSGSIMAGCLFCGSSPSCLAAFGPGGQRLPPGGLAAAAGDSLR